MSTLPGGKGANQATAAALLGGDVRIVGAVGDDSNGELLRGSLETAGVDTSWLSTVTGVATGTAMITVTGNGENTIVASPGANEALTAAHVCGADAFSCRVVLGLCLEIELDVVSAAAERAHEAGVVVLLNLSPFTSVPRELLALTDVLLVNEQEATQLLGVDVESADPAAVLAELARLGITRAVVTRGPAGSFVVDSGVFTTVDSFAVRAVDTTGCGDAFMGSLAVRLAAGDSLAVAAQFATAVGAFAATGEGAQSSYPTLPQLTEFLERYLPGTSEVVEMR